jgi:hypothetical protein
MRHLLKLAAAAAFLGSVSVAGAEDVHVKSTVGTWKLNIEKSKTEAWTAKSQTRVYEEREGGLLHARYEGTDARGNASLVEFEARLDGKPYPYAVRGVQISYTISLKPVDDRSWAFEVRQLLASPWLDRNGAVHESKPAWTGTHTVAADGKSFADSYKNDYKGEPSRAVLVFDKQ